MPSNKKSRNYSYNHECSICMDDFETNTFVILSCHHSFHSDCIIKHIEILHHRLTKRYDNIYLFCRQFNCPLCRQAIVCNDISKITYKKYIEQKKKYDTIKSEIKHLQTKSYWLSIKFKCRHIFKHPEQKEVYDHLVEDDTLLEVIMQKKMEYQDIKNKLHVYEKLYYGRCMCCVCYN